MAATRMLQAHGVTHAGRVRGTNEDTVHWDTDLGLFIVADGMGGHNAGEVASKLAVEAVKGFMARSHAGEDFTWPYGVDPNLSFFGNLLATSIKIANRRVFKAGESHDEYTGLGTTIVAALLEDEQFTFSGVGDSRIYVYSKGKLEQLTRDDSWVATVLARDPAIDQATLASHPMRHVLTNVLGAREQIEMDVVERSLDGGEAFLLCSDGLHGAVDDATLEQFLASNRPVHVMAQELVNLALERDGSDNITALVVRNEKSA